ncbi:hypothetical protein GCM10027515_07160 [Schumannella luteola]|uniref:Uncharacterized protein n=1 Tax=Schumannella luteola TaxID=472059 RepID=A0A852Y759_9MICO|nr:hypothetical protein [Schumannella luteola]NYG98153.1 hypothetical protein [Schumannella luteola]TPX01870.1 hypothetical protein FJ656_26160 [Schumannella luteola]
MSGGASTPTIGEPGWGARIGIAVAVAAAGLLLAIIGTTIWACVWSLPYSGDEQVGGMTNERMQEGIRRHCLIAFVLFIGPFAAVGGATAGFLASPTIWRRYWQHEARLAAELEATRARLRGED